ncbi:MAG TPA: efflux RND transporter periplasmic adaptor subunit [Verrucomicrobiae bacterium]
MLTAFIVTAASLLPGCGHKEGDGHDHDESGHSHGDGHGHGEESPSGASFKAGKGVMVTDETKKILKLETVEVAEKKLPDEVRFTVQVFGEQHRHAANLEDHSACDTYGSGLVSMETLSTVKAGQPVYLSRGTNVPLTGVVLAVQKALALGEGEIVVGVSNASTALKSGEFVPARILQPRSESVTSVPQSALLRTSEGSFVYAVNGEAYFRTAVKTGAISEGWVEIKDGLLAGDAVVVTALETLWLIELRATKGGGHSH